MRSLLNAAVDPNGRSLFGPDDYERVRGFFDGRPDFPATPLHRSAALAASLGLDRVLVKDESRRFGLNAFKIVGVTFALDQLARAGAIDSRSVLVCATAGNHGRAVARAAASRGLRARVYVPALTVQARIEAIRSEGADVIVSPGSYDDVVKRAAAEAEQHGWTIVSDTAWPGYDNIPRLIMAGYTWIFEEAARQWEPDAAPDAIVVQAGVGGLAAAAASWAAARYGRSRPALVAAEPSEAACLMASVAAGHPAPASGSLDTTMAGLRCAEMSPAAWPAVHEGIDGCVGVTDEEAFSAMRALARPIDTARIMTASSGACGLGALIAMRQDPELRSFAEAVRVRPGTSVLVVVTEGETDPDLGRRVLGAQSIP